MQRVAKKSIAQKLYLAKADYLLVLKGNQRTLHKRVESFFGSNQDVAHAKEQGEVVSNSDEESKAHGRIERRIVVAPDFIDCMDKYEIDSWLGLRSIFCVEAHREEIITGKKSVQKRYYITAHEPDASLLPQLIRQHWSIENQCHWILDMTCKEDESRIRKEHAVENLALFRKLAFNLLKEDTTFEDTVRGKRLRATFDENILTEFLKLNFSN